MIPRARRAPSNSYTGEGRGYIDQSRARHMATQAFADAAYEDEFARGGAAARRSLNAWLSGRSTRGS